MKNLGSFSISLTQSHDFARASGDFNPLHTDPIAARRTRFGKTLIHGVYGTLKALDLYLQKFGKNTNLTSIKVKYSKPVTQGQILMVTGDSKDKIIRLELFADSVRCQIIEFELNESCQPEVKFVAASHDSANTCAELSIDTCTGLSGTVDLIWDKDIVQALFPSAALYLPAHQLATIVACTQIVGMRCPGLHSVFAQLDLRFATDHSNTGSSSNSQLEYSLLNVDARIDRVVLSVRNAYAEGAVEAFFRPPPAQQASFQQIATMVEIREFSDQNALVIGSSRGLGEVITKVLAAGGANLLMTYAVGRDDAVRVSEEIGEKQPHPTVCHYDVLEGSLCAEMIEFCASVTHIYYLASPTIVKSDSNDWDRQLFTRYCDYYIDGLAKLLQQVWQAGPGNHREIRLFIPSSVFLEQDIKGFDEYIAAKAAAEAFVRSFEKAHRNCRVVAPRLPRMHTDQTSSVRGIDQQHTLDVILGQLRQAFTSASNPVNARKQDEIWN